MPDRRPPACRTPAFRPPPPPSISPCSFSLTGNFPVLICLQWCFARGPHRRLSVSLLLELFQSSSAAKLFLLRTNSNSTRLNCAFEFGANCELGHLQHTGALSLPIESVSGFSSIGAHSSEREGRRPNTLSQSHRTSCCFLPLIARLSFPFSLRGRGHLLRGRANASQWHTHALIHLVSENRKIVAAPPAAPPACAFLFQHWCSTEPTSARWSWSPLHFLFGDNLTSNPFTILSLVLQKHEDFPQNYGARLSVCRSMQASKQAPSKTDPLLR